MIGINSNRLSSDTGGTFTDIVFIDSKGSIKINKVPTTKSDQSIGVKNGVENLSNFDYSPHMIHGTTVATNMLLERKGAQVLLLTTEGFKDIIEIGRQNRINLYQPPEKPIGLTKRENRIGVSERIDFQGKVIKELNVADLIKKLNTWEKQNNSPPESVAVCNLFSFTNYLHEMKIKEVIKNKWPDVQISLSIDVLPVFREFERTIATVIDAYISPGIKIYLKNIEDSMHSINVEKTYILQSNTGISSPKNLLPAQAVLSGLAGGVLGGQYSAKKIGLSNIINIDIGGTSTDVSLLNDMKIPISTNNYIAGFPFVIPTVDVVTIGAGGGSIAWVDKQGLLQVGPKSTGAEPGPACYGKDLIPCLTDADMILGYLNPKNFAGGTVPLYPERSKKAVNNLLSELNGISDIDSLALGIQRVFHTNIGYALRAVSVDRGFDPRDFTLVSFGGAGSTHCAPLAELLSMKQILVPPYPGAWSAFGLLNTDFKYEFTKSIIKKVDDLDFSELDKAYISLEIQGKKNLFNDGFNDSGIAVNRYADCRYYNQSYELAIPLHLLKAEEFQNFHSIHKKRYGYELLEDPIELVNIRTETIGKVSLPKIENIPKGSPKISEEAIKNYRKVIFNQKIILDVPVIQRKKLLSGNIITEPSIIEQLDTTTIIHPGWKARVMNDGHILMKKIQ
ncbi:MAG: Acetophenone carboxylase gamma subunit [Candidatus Heimdallarchaeota archaeon LC_3]|nr:MAG: Acetophenone carboxylase gamma subunit [Candidatus Heimdallarchaeota archaeon LC_3]